MKMGKTNLIGKFFLAGFIIFFILLILSNFSNKKETDNKPNISYETETEPFASAEIDYILKQIEKTDSILCVNKLEELSKKNPIFVAKKLTNILEILVKSNNGRIRSSLVSIVSLLSNVLSYEELENIRFAFLDTYIKVYEDYNFFGAKNNNDELNLSNILSNLEKMDIKIDFNYVSSNKKIKVKDSIYDNNLIDVIYALEDIKSGNNNVISSKNLANLWPNIKSRKIRLIMKNAVLGTLERENVFVNKMEIGMALEQMK